MFCWCVVSTRWLVAAAVHECFILGGGGEVALGLSCAVVVVAHGLLAVGVVVNAIAFLDGFLALTARAIKLSGYPAWVAFECFE
jgi:hypothetical protein